MCIFSLLSLLWPLQINGARGIPPNFTDLHCRYKFYLDATESSTALVRTRELFGRSHHWKVAGTMNPDFNYSRQLTFPVADKKLIDHLMSYVSQHVRFKRLMAPRRALVVEVWARQVAGKANKVWQWQMFRSSFNSPARNYSYARKNDDGCQAQFVNRPESQ